MNAALTDMLDWPVVDGGIDTLESPPDRCISGRMALNTPFVIRDVVPPDVLEGANPERIASENPDEELEVMWEAPRTRFLERFDDEGYRTVTLSEFIDHLLDEDGRNSACYANQKHVSHFPSIRDEEVFRRIPTGDDQDTIPSKSVWIGSEDANIGLHCHVGSLLAQLHGSKHVFLAPPWASKAFAPYRTEPTRSPVDPRDLTDDQRADGGHPPGVAETLHPGDVLYIPDFWWHYLWTPEVSVSTSTFGVPDGARTWSFLDFTAKLPFTHGGSRATDVIKQFLKHGLLGIEADFPEGYGWPPYGYLLWAYMMDDLDEVF